MPDKSAGSPLIQARRRSAHDYFQSCADSPGIISMLELLGQPLVKSNFEPVAHPLESGENARYTSFIYQPAFCGHMTMRGETYAGHISHSAGG